MTIRLMSSVFNHENTLRGNENSPFAVEGQWILDGGTDHIADQWIGRNNTLELVPYFLVTYARRVDESYHSVVVSTPDGSVYEEIGMLGGVAPDTFDLIFAEHLKSAVILLATRLRAL